MASRILQEGIKMTLKLVPYPTILGKVWYCYDTGIPVVCHSGLKKFFIIDKKARELVLHASDKSYGKYTLQLVANSCSNYNNLYINNQFIPVYGSLRNFVKAANTSGKYYFWVEIL